MQLVLVFVSELVSLAAEMLQEIDDEGSRARRRIEDFHVLVDQLLAKMLLAEPVGAFDHEAHDFVRRIGHAQPVGSLAVIDLVKTLVDHLQEFLLFLMAEDDRRRALDGDVIGF